MKLHRYWFKKNDIIGVGVTAYTLDDAHILLQKAKQASPWLDIEFTEIIEDVDIQTLDQAHVRRYMGVCSQRGIWFPPGVDPQ